MKFLGSLLLTSGFVLASSSDVAAHITLKVPKPRTVANSGQKGPPPCGNVTPAENPQKYRAGETLMIEWDETIPTSGISGSFSRTRELRSRIHPCGRT